MRVDVREVDGVILVDLEGRLVAGTGDEVLREVMNELLGSNWRRIVLNLSEVTKIDSSGIGELVASSKLAERVESEVKVVNLQDHVRRILELSLVLPMLDVHDSEEEALAAFAEGAEQAAEVG